jgi:23S rRNA (cytidine1920-2'-O)/16S rRNA (cytidine1409-2'-O)-methyltransferase
VTGKRLDEVLVSRGHFASRSRARDAVLRGTVQVNGQAARKVAQTVSDADVLSVADPAQDYVSRAALKLVRGLDHFGIAVMGRVALDIGASTGGFTQVLLARGAAHVVAVDVGHGQMAEEVAKDARVTRLDGVNARELTRDQVKADTTLIVSDVSFISLRLALPAALALVPVGADLVALIKPQFEVGREHVGKGGVVNDPAQHRRVCEDISAFLAAAGWTVRGLVDSPVRGGDGNREFLLAAVKA